MKKLFFNPFFVSHLILLSISRSAFLFALLLFFFVFRYAYTHFIRFLHSLPTFPLRWVLFFVCVDNFYHKPPFFSWMLTACVDASMAGRSRDKLILTGKDDETTVLNVADKLRILMKSWDLSQVDGFFALVESGSVSPFLFSFELLTLRTLRVWFSLKSGNICVPCFLEIPSLGVTYIVRFNRFDNLALQSPEVRSRGALITWKCNAIWNLTVSTEKGKEGSVCLQWMTETLKR